MRHIWIFWRKKNVKGESYCSAVGVAVVELNNNAPVELLKCRNVGRVARTKVFEVVFLR